MAVQLKEWVAKETNVNTSVASRVISLINEGNTVPFIARYRKEATGGLDEVQIKQIQDKWQYAVNLSERKEEVIRLIDEQGKLTEELKQAINEATQLQRVEDLYRPYKQKRRTRATKAKEKGLEPLALRVWEQSIEDLTSEASEFISVENELPTLEKIFQGVNDIVAEWLSDEPVYREHIRNETFKRGSVRASVKDSTKDEQGIYEMYYDFQESIRSLVSHRVLALNRGEQEEVLKVSVEPPEEQLIGYLKSRIIRKDVNDEVRDLLIRAIEDGFKRLIKPAVAREVRNQLTEQAEEQAIDVFTKNVRNLLLQPPLKEKIVLGVDPAYRTGCKLSAVDETGKVLEVGVMYPTPPANDKAGAEKTVLDFISRFGAEIIAIGNGTASRETEQFISDVIGKHSLDVSYIIVNEAGASVYSASELAREEFPNLQVEERSAASIARRLQDPLAELVKIDPKSIGVGQYQHDVNQKSLNASLTFVVETVVNQVGVNVNTASTALLQYVSGLSKAVAKNIVNRVHEEGKFNNRSELKSVPKLGAKTYEQSIGFLRVFDGSDPLDRTPIHPESYNEVEQLLQKVGYDKQNIGTSMLQQQLKEIDVNSMAEQLDIGVWTLQDIINALSRPERDPRDDLPKPLLKQNVLTIDDLRFGMELQGTVRNVVDFGVFVDIGVKQDGLVHISKMSQQFVKHPMDITSVGDVVTVWVEDIDIDKGRIALSMIEDKN